jgi:hypothetical protein
MRFPPLRRICHLIVCSSFAAAACAQTPALRNFTHAQQSFEPNRGQAAKHVDFISSGPGYSLSLTSNAAYLQLFSAVRPDHAKQTSTLALRLVGANAWARADGLNRQQGRSNYLLGSASSRWLTDVPQYGRVEYHDVYPGIDMAYYGTNEHLEYDFILGPHADPRRIRLAVNGADRIRIDDAGDLVITVGSAEIRERRPLIYQQTASGQSVVRGRYVALEGNQIGFTLEKYDPGKALVIDPVLVFSTYFGGSSADYGNGIAVDSDGNSYIAGQTGSANLTGTDIGDPGFTGSDTAAFVAKVSPSGALLSTTIIAGANDAAEAGAVALDTDGNIYLCGYTSSASFPTLNPIMTYQGGGDVFVLELNNAGNALVYSTYLGGGGLDYGDGIAVDSKGNTLVGGATTSANFPAVNAAQTNLAGGYNPWAAKIAPGGSKLVYSTYWGGSDTDYANGLAIDSSGDLILFGDESSMNFPVVHAFQPNYCALASGTEVSTVHGWVAEFSPAGVPIYSTYICGTVTYYTVNGTSYPTFDAVRGGTVDTAGNAVITGTTASLSFPTMNPVQADFGGGLNSAFLTKISPTGSLLYSTYLGGSANTSGNDVAVDPQDDIFVVGQTSSGLPTVNPTQNVYGGGGSDAFLMKLNPTGSAILFSTYIGGNGADSAIFLGVDGVGDAYVTGSTNSTNFPTASPMQANYGGGADDAFLTVIQTKIMPTVSVTPPTSSIAEGKSLTITITVSGGGGNPTPTGTVTLSSGSYTSAATALSGGIANIVIPPVSLAVGTDTLRATYSGDTNNLTNTGTASATVTPQALLTAPSPGSVFTGTSATFQWTSAPGAVNSELFLGSTGPGSYNLYYSGNQTGNSLTINGLPINGETIYARLYTRFSAGLVYIDYTYTATTVTTATLTAPTPGTTLTAASATFTWSAVPGVTNYELFLGSTGPGSYNVFYSGNQTVTSLNVTGLPVNGEIVYARLYTRIGETLTYNDYTYTAASLTPAMLTAPTAGSTFTATSATFTWSAASGATNYELFLGSTGPGSYNVFYSGDRAVTSLTATGLPTNGEKIYARLYTRFNATLVYEDYTFTATTLPPAALISPSAGSAFSSASQTFTWNSATGATYYELFLGSTGPDSYNLYYSGHITATSVTVNNLPTNGETIYARLYTNFNGVLEYYDYTFTAR